MSGSPFLKEKLFRQSYASEPHLTVAHCFPCRTRLAAIPQELFLVFLIFIGLLYPSYLILLS